ncbi:MULTISPECIES: hypothetical protein [Lachnospiraceae]|uniref:hypothetical protein n=1 Tax=Lachnospiraceae TaxID=186803 RepID=UPI0018A8A6E1|nr:MULTISPECIES: hypothetical protein [Lachnospiraceae]
METKELEKMAYLYLCSPKDREKILGRKPMSYDDFQRLYYLAEYIGFPAFALAFFNRYAENFQVQESVLEKIHDGWDKDLYCDTEYYLEERARWVSSFLEGVPSMVRKEVREYVKSHDDSWEVYEEIMKRLHLPC